MTINDDYSEGLFYKAMHDLFSQIAEFSNYDLVVGIPFYHEKPEQLQALLYSVDKVLESWIGRRQLIICIGDSAAAENCEMINKLKLTHPQIAFVLPAEISGRGNSIRAMLEIGKRLEADLLIFNANMAGNKGPGIEDAWLENLLTPIQGHYDMVLGSLRRFQGMDSIAHMLAAPILESFYGCRISDPLGGIYALAHDFVEELAREARFWGQCIGGYGIDFWLLTRALCWDKSICEVNMGGAVTPHTLASRNRIFYDTSLALFECLKRDSAIWLQERLVIKVTDILARREVKKADLTVYPIPELLQNFKTGCSQYANIIEQCSAQEMIAAIVNLPEDRFRLSDELWVRALFQLFLLYCFESQNSCTAEILSSLTALYNGRVASYTLDMHAFSRTIADLPDEDKEEMLVHKMESVRQNLTNQFWQLKSEMTQHWLQRSEQQKPAFVPLGYMEYVPGKPVVVPKQITGPDQKIVSTDNIFKQLRKSYEEKFNAFINEGLGVVVSASPDNTVAAVRQYVSELESVLEQVLPGDLHTREGMQEFVDGIFSLYKPGKMFSIHSDLLREMLVRFPPINLMIPLGFYRVEDLVASMDPRDAVTYANLVESWIYTDRDLLWLVDNIKPESFGWVDLKAIILSGDLNMGIIYQNNTSNLNRITARIAVKTLEKGRGGKYPRIRYFTNLIRRLAMVENYSRLFSLTISERKNIGIKIRNSLLGLQKGDEFSAHNIFENLHHRRMVVKLQEMAELLDNDGKHEAARLFRLMSQSYGLSQVLENETFLTCTAWSWASYSFKGGLKIPSPATTSVESRWFNHDFLERLYMEFGYEPAEVEQLVFHLIQSGKSSSNLLDALLPARPRDVAVVVQEITTEPSRHLQRYKGNPILEPLENSAWESKYVLNPGSLRIGEKVYLFYRAVGVDDISRIGLAITDGYRLIERLPDPIFVPEGAEEKMGCEDPRLIIVDDKIFMLYTAYDGNIAQIAAASIGVADFKSGNYTNWHREGLAFKNIWDKDAILFPEKINGKYVIYHRIEPSIWVTYMKDLKFPIREKHAIIIGPRPGRMWDSLKIGAGAQPLKTKYGWLLIYHGVDYNYVYRLGVILVDRDNPQKVLYRSPNPILEPEEEYEIGLSGAWVPNVVFTCGAVAGTDKEVLEDEDEILVYYGAADTSIGVAIATLADLIPAAFRNQNGKHIKPVSK